MKSFYRKLFLIKGILKYLYNPSDVESVLSLGNLVSSEAGRQETINRIKQTPEIRVILDEKYGAQDFNFSTLSSFQEGTLGREFYNYIKRQDLDPEFYKFKAPKAEDSDLAFLTYRLRKTHDIWHLVTDFKTTEEGEAGLIAFYYSQLGSPLSGLIVGLSFVHFLLRRRKEMPLLLNEVCRGWELGKRAKPLVAIKWEERWGESLNGLREELNLAK